MNPNPLLETQTPLHPHQKSLVCSLAVGGIFVLHPRVPPCCPAAWIVGCWVPPLNDGINQNKENQNKSEYSGVTNPNPSPAKPADIQKNPKGKDEVAVFKWIIDIYFHISSPAKFPSCVCWMIRMVDPWKILGMQEHIWFIHQSPCSERFQKKYEVRSIRKSLKKIRSSPGTFWNKSNKPWNRNQNPPCIISDTHQNVFSF